MKNTRQNRKFIKRVVSMVTAMALLSVNLPMQELRDAVKLIDFIDLSRFAIKTNAEATYDTTKFETIDGESYTNLANGMSMDQGVFAEYSRCYKNDSGFASRHSGDTIMLITSGYFKLDSTGDNQFEPLGTSENPFAGTIRINAMDSTIMKFIMDVPFFDVVCDTVSIYKGTTSDTFPLEFIKTSNNSNPLMANEVRHSGNGGGTWKAILSGTTEEDDIDGQKITYGNFYTYGGVIGSMGTGAVLTLDYTDDSTATQCYVKRDTAQGVLCGEMLSGSSLTATYTNANRTISVGDEETNSCSGGLIGSMTGATFTLNNAVSLDISINSGNQYAGLIVGSASSNSTIQFADSLSFSGSVTSSSERVGGIVGSLQGSDICVGSTGDGSVTLSGVSISGTDRAGGVIGYFAPSANNSNALSNISYTLSNCTIGGNKPGGIIGEYVSVGGENVDVSNFTFNNTIMSRGSAGGIFGKYIANGNTTLTGSYTPPKSSTDFGGVIGEYSNNVLSRTLSLSNLGVSSITQTAGDKKLGGVLLKASGASYIDVNDVTVSVTGNNVSHEFGGIVSTLGDTAANGSFLDVTGDFTLTTSKPYKGGAFAYSFKNGVMRLAGTTDIGEAKTANGYGQLIYENDTTLVYSTGTGSNAAWTFKRNNDTTASDLGQWGEVVRFSNMETDIVTVDSTAHTVTLAAATTSVTNPTTFANLALNMQLNDAKSHGALLFANMTSSSKQTLLCSDSSISITGKISLSGTGLLGLTRDGGNGKYVKSSDNTFGGSPHFFKGTITGSSSAAEIELAVGEAYGCNASGNALSSGANGGRIYLSNNYGHDAQGLIAFGDGATIDTLKISGTMLVSRVAGSDCLYLSPVFGVITNGAALTDVNVAATVTIDKKNDSIFYIGGAVGLFDGTENGEKTLSVSRGSIAPTFNLNGSVDCTSDDKTCTYAGGVLGLLRGAANTNYKVTLSNTDISPIISLGADVSDTTESYIGGVIGYVKDNSTNEREILFDTVTMTGASIEQKAQHSGGLLGSYWERTKVTINGLTISSSSVRNTASTANELSGLVYQATGNWNVNTLSISDTAFSAESAAHTCFGLIVNRAYKGNDGLYLNLKNAGYTLSNITMPSSTSDSYYVDEIAANTASSADNVVAGGNGVGIININMNSADGTLSNITDITVNNSTTNGTGTYQNKALSNNKLISNQNSRYYYNLDVIKAKAERSDGEKFLMWSIYNNYAAANIKDYDVISNDSISESDLTNIDLRGLSYYPVNISSVILPEATFTFGYSAINTLETSKGSDSWARYPASNGDMKTNDETRRNQHYLMQNSLFGNVTGSLGTSGEITFAGDFGGANNAGVIVGNTLTGNINLTKGVTLDNFSPFSFESPMLVNSINGTASDVSPQFKLSKLRLTNYLSQNTSAVASALIHNAEGTGMQIIFSDIKLDARDGNSNSGMAAAATTAMNTAYGTSRSIFKYASLIRNLKSNSTDTIEYNYTWDEDWGKVKVNGEDVAKRNVTYGNEITNSVYYKDEDDSTKSGERRYSGTKRIFTNPTVDTDTEFDFSTGFLPYVANKSKNLTYDISEVKVNFVSTGLVDGCGTYNDPYVITSAQLLTKVAKYINSSASMLDTVRLPNSFNATWHEEATGHSLYKKDNTDKTVYVKSADDDTLAISGWNQSNVREYLAGAYYVIPDDLILTSDFPGIGRGGASEKGKTVFHGVIVGQKKSDGTYPTITNNTVNPFIYISNGSVIKNLNFVVDNSTNSQSIITISQENAGSGADYTFSYKDITDTDSSNKTAKYYGGIFGEIMGGDNIIDSVTVEYTENRPFKLTGNNKQLIAIGGFAGAVVNGGLIFRGSDSVTGFTVYDNDNATNALDAGHTATIYANPYVGRVINGYAVNEGTSTLNNTTKHYTIDSITPPAETNKLNVSGSKITVPDAQAFFIMSLITQSTAGTASSANGDYGVSQSYGVNSDVFCGSNRLGTYADVGKKHKVNGNSVIYTNKSDIADYNNKAINDVANADDTTRETAVPYIISAYTKAVSGAYPARTITYDNTKFWDIELSESGSFDLSVYPSFRGIGCMGNKATIYNMKIGTFDGSGKTINLSMLESRYGRNAENYFHQENYSNTTTFVGETLDAYNYGHDQNLYKLMGFGLFDNVSVKKDSTHQYQFQNFTLKGNIDEKVYNSSGNDITGTNDQSQLFCIGGAVGKRVNFAETNTRRGGDYDQGNKSDLNFKDITFDGLKISGSYSCGGLIGIDSLNNYREMKIVNCNSTANGVEVTGGFYGKSGDTSLRHGVGSFVGMTFQCRPIIDGDNSETDATEKADIFVAKVDTHYIGNENRCNVGGLIGYSGTGATIKNINLKAANESAVIGSEKAANSSGFIAFGQYASTAANDYLKNSIYIENCTMNNISVKAKNSASGFYGRCNNEKYGPRYIYISDCSIIGNGNVEIKAYGAGETADVNYAGGLLACSNATGRTDNIIQNSYVSGYKIEGYYVGGIVGRVVNNQLNVKNVYVKNCNINTYKDDNGYAGGFVGFSNQNLNGYNMKIENINFKLRSGSDNTGKAGAFVGNSSSKTVKFVAVAKYHSDSSKIPSADIKNGTNENNIIVFSDYTGQSLTNTKNTANISSFGKTNMGGNITDQNKEPYLTLNPSSSMGTGEYISGDGAYQLDDDLTGYGSYTSGKSAAAHIYADWKAGTAFSNVTLSAPYSGASTPNKDSIGAFFKRTADSGDFKVSTWNTEMGIKSGVDDFTLLVINDANDPENTTNFIDNYIRLMTGTTTHYMKDVPGKYKIVIKACRYNSDTNKFELQDSVTPGLTRSADALNSTDGKTYTNGYYQMNLANADSKYDAQFTLIDVQYYDPTTYNSSSSANKIAYHLYVPVLTKKTVNIEFSAVSMSGSDYKAQNYISKIGSEIAAGKNANNPTTIVDSMDVWTTTYIRFTYPVSQVNDLLKLGTDLQWNHDKKVGIYWGMENNIPDNTKLVLIDPNNDADEVYYSTAGQFQVANKTRTVDFSAFTKRSSGSGANFHEPTLYSLLDGKVKPQANSNSKGAYNEVSSTTSGALHFKVNGEDKYYQYVNGTGTLDLVVTEPIYEDYYLSLLVPKTSGQADVVQIQPAGMANALKPDGTAATGNAIRATVTSKLNAALVIGDFYQHNVEKFTMKSELNSSIITEANKVLTATSVAKISLINNDEGTQAPYFANVLSNQSIYHSFNIQMIRSNSANSSTDIIQGIEKNNISATYKINDGTPQAVSASNIIRESSHIQCTTGDIKSYLTNADNDYSVTITGITTMDFVGYSEEFPSNSNEASYIGVRGAVRSNISYQKSDLPYSKMNAPHDPVNPYFYIKEDNSALFSFDAIDELDDEEIGTNTKNNSKLGVNDHFVYNNLIHGKSVYNALDVRDYAESTSIVYTLELFRKTTTNGTTEYVQVNFPDYITASSIQLVDSEIPTGTGSLTQEVKTKSVGGNTVTYYEYSRDVDLNGIDKDAIFYTDFACNVLKGTAFTKKEYANYKIQLTVRLEGSVNNERTSYIIYTNAKIDPAMIDEAVP